MATVYQRCKENFTLRIFNLCVQRVNKRVLEIFTRSRFQVNVNVEENNMVG